MYHFVALFFLALFLRTTANEENANTIPASGKTRYRSGRHCQHRVYAAFDPFYRQSVLENSYSLVFIVFLGILFGLMFLGTQYTVTCGTFLCLDISLGLAKAFLGLLGSRTLGEYGLGMLMDLPRPLESYREKELRGRKVCYDVVGWPVHPDTGERNVRMLPVKMEFCLNVIFFLAYPLVIIIKLCSLCCCIGEYRGEENSCFKEVNVIKCKSSKKNTAGPTVDMYRGNDLRESKDTRYVINCMKQSQMSLERLRQNEDF